MRNLVVLANWMSWRDWSFPSGANGNRGGAGGKPDSHSRTMMGTIGGGAVQTANPVQTTLFLMLKNFYYLGLAARKTVPRKKKPLPLPTPDRLTGLSVFAQRYFEALSAMLPVP